MSKEFPMKIRFAISVLGVMALLLATGSAAASPLHTAVGTSFTYQGRLTDGGSPADGEYDFQFALFDADTGGTQVGSTLTPENVMVSSGLFTVHLDFGSVFDGTALFLEIGVRPWDSMDPYTTLTPRQPLTAVPYALNASSAPWSGLSGIPSGFADGVDNGEAYTAGTGLTLVSNQFSVNTAEMQTRVADTCPAGSAMSAIASDGSVTCESVGTGDITGVTAGLGLSGGATAGDATLDLDFGGSGTENSAARSDHDHDATYVNEGQTDSVTSGMITDGEVAFGDMSLNGCTNGQVIKSDGSTWICAADNDNDSGGTLTQVSTGAGLTGGPITTTGTISLADDGVTSSKIQDGTIAFTDWSSNGCTAGYLPKWSGTAWVCAADEDTNSGGTLTQVSTGAGLTGGPITGSGTISLADDGVTSSKIQDGTIAFADWSSNGCTAGYLPKWSGTAWECAADNDTNSGGTITQVSTGSGLTGGPITGSGSISLADSGVTSAKILDGTIQLSDLSQNGCSGGQVMKWNGAAWACAADNDTNSGGTVTQVSTGSGLTGGPITGTGTISLADNGVTSGKIQDATIQLADLGQNGCSGGQVMKWNGAAWACAADDNTTYTAGDGLELVSGTQFKGKGTAYQNMVIVAKSGGDYTTIQSALNSITDASASNPYLIWVGPGVYTEDVTMKPYVDIEGAGELATKITRGGWNDSLAGTVIGTNNAELRFLTVESVGGTTNAVAIYNGGTSPRLTHITLNVSGGTHNYGIANYNSSSPMMTDVTVTVSGGTSSIGMDNSWGSSPSMTNVIVSVTGGTDYNFGAYNRSSSPTMSGGSINVSGGNSTVGVYNNTFSSPIFNNVTIKTSGTVSNEGMFNLDGSAIINNSTISASGGTTNYGIHNTEYYGGTYTVQVNNSQVTGSTNTILDQRPYSPTRIGASQLSGGAVGGTGTIVCAGVYDESYTFYASTCP
jgi:hypothetical protein